MKIPHIPEQEQVINVIVTSTLRKKLGAQPGDFFRLMVNNTLTGQSYFFRSRVTHSMKVAPGVDLYRSFAYMTESQASYLFEAIGYNTSQLHYNKLFITGVGGLKEIGNRILSMSPDHTSVIEISQVRLSF
jgi:ABC-type lipoprotein release transport system permease subunit